MPALLDAVAPFAAAVAWRATALLVAGAGTVVLLRRASPALRHRLWRLTLGAMLALPVAMWLVPSVSVATPLLGVSIPTSMTPVTTAHTTRIARATDMGRAPSASAVRPVAASTDERADVVDMGPMLLGLWGIGAGLLLATTLAGTVRHRLRYAGLPRLDDPAMSARVRLLAAQLDIRRHVRVVLGARDAMPSTWGVVRPVVLLPADAAQWPVERLDAVLAHELAHVARHDVAARALAATVCALFWWHPLAWLAARGLARTAEHACDDLALAAGQRPSSYAAALLAVASAPRTRPRLALALPLATGEGTLRGRIDAVLAPARTRRTPSWRARTASLGASVLVTGALASLRPTPVLLATTPPVVAPAWRVDRDSARPAMRAGAASPTATRARARRIASPPDADMVHGTRTVAMGDTLATSPDGLMTLVVRADEIALRYTPAGQRWADSIAHDAAARAGVAATYAPPTTGDLMRFPRAVIGRVWAAGTVVGIETRDRVARTPDVAVVTEDSARTLVARVRKGGLRGVFTFETADAASARALAATLTPRPSR